MSVFDELSSSIEIVKKLSFPVNLNIIFFLHRVDTKLLENTVHNPPLFKRSLLNSISARFAR
jgi:hypothetical protein